MQRFSSAVVVIVCLGLSGPMARAEHKHHGTKSGHKMADSGDCHLPVQLDAAAEDKPGGAGYAGPVAPHHGPKAKSAQMVPGAHTRHNPRFGGAFFMAPNKLHHLEVVYSDKCGVRLVIYNIATEPIAVDRFRAFVEIEPESDQEPEMIRFLEPAMNGAYLASTVRPVPARPFTIELYLKLPGDDEPQLFTVPVR
ncbi:MAG: hypothetical protein QF578_02645 [Alphaproteobacteria bacterium]|jgi:hypothetical protein|nr:hypothetical protein [Alphaproteobacteria bacterium]MDP6563699.1 hypothetical protein [Alphaproteobacteria bacterium]MDP6814553.1 hypothetical protein [Alphaproteobacteria bacterium]